MIKNGRLVSINGTDITITGMDYDYANNKENTKQNNFNITFDVTVNNKLFVINFSNERLSNQGHYLADNFIGTGDAYSQFLQELEGNSRLDNIKPSNGIERAANDVIGAIAQSVYINLQSHSPDQDEE